ncbi:MAG: ComEC/Rec2 family competence protein [Planctomycetota bacterium]|jgi:beta-lactamase superfamily II metal-dependent hydrolase
MAEEVRFVKHETTDLFRESTGDETRAELLWGDRLRILEAGSPRTKVRARGRIGFVKNSAMGTKSLLELYFIDVGQGDGILIRMPDHRHVLIDGGWPRFAQDTGKNAADFVDWKFKRDYGADKIALDAVICSHNDQDHYGGLWDLLNPNETEELDLDEVVVENFYHAGLSWWRGSSGKTLGPHVSTQFGGMFTRLLGDRDTVVEALKSNADPKLAGEWAKFLKVVRDTTTEAGDPTPITRLSDQTGFVPGYEAAAGQPSVRVLAPVEFEVDGKPAIRRFAGGDSKNTNGNSVLLRLDFKDVRILLTGDLNTKSQHSLLEDYEGAEGEFECDVAKACHHGSDDISFEFLEKVYASATVISSGDNEGHDHPRPNIVGASAMSGFKSVADDELVTPLVYSTELARSVGFGTPTQLDFLDAQNQVTETVERSGLKSVNVTYREKKSGDRAGRVSTRRLSSRKILGRMLYGLVNVRTDGEKILCAVMNEKDATWQIKMFPARNKPTPRP